MPNCLICDSSPTIKAHIVPKSMARHIRGNGTRNISISEREIREAQLGYFDPDILCGPCDQHLGRYDKVAIEFVRKFEEKHRIFEHDPGFFIMDDVDCDAICRFVLAILWRASVSSLPQFESVRLGPYEPAIRAILFEDKPVGHCQAFDLFMLRVHSDQLSMEQVYSLPQRRRWSDMNAYIFNLPGFYTIAKLSNSSLPDPLDFIAINRTNVMRGMFQKFEDTSDFKGLVHSYRKARYAGASTARR